MTDANQNNMKNSELQDQFAKMLLNVTNKLAAAEGLNQALATLVEITTSTIGAERGSIFLNNPSTSELYTRVAQGELSDEIRIMNTVGIAGWVFTNRQGVIIHDPYSDSRFNSEIDERTGFKTKSVLCVPMVSVKGELIGVTQILNKINGAFTKRDLELLEAMTQQAAVTIQNNIIFEQMEASYRKELEFLDVVSQVSNEIQLSSLLTKIINSITRMLDAERSTLFINDEKKNELFTEVGEGLGKTQIRFPNHLGIAGTVFTSKKAVNIPYAYADLRFNPEFDKKTGFFTRSILCCPVLNKQGKVIGVTQVLNKRGGSFQREDELKLEAFTSQIAMGIENAKLFDDMQAIKNYNESILESMTNGVITSDEEGKIITCNEAGVKIFELTKTKNIIGSKISDFFIGPNEWIAQAVAGFAKVTDPTKIEVFMDRELFINDKSRSVNITIQPLIGSQKNSLGSVTMIEDISNEKRMKSTMSRYMDSGLADKLLKGGDEILGGISSVATILFSDIRGFTTFTEALGAEGTVSLLNEYFSIMVEIIQSEGGMLDKFIGDAMMAVFGTPFPHEDDPDRAVRTSIKMITALEELNQKRKLQDKLPIKIGIGLNTDKVVSGNIGSPKRMDYTVIGDGVNLASRLESACKQYGAQLLISEGTFKALKATYRTRLVDKVIVKGKTLPVAVYEVLDFMNDSTFPNMIECLGHFNNGITYYQKARWDDAKKCFQTVLGLNPQDFCSQMYVERCDYLKEHPPEGEWDGVWKLKSK